MNVSGNNPAAVSKLNLIFFSLLLSKSNTNVGGIGGNAEEYYKLSHFKHVIADNEGSFTVDKQNHTFTWSEKFVLDSTKADIRAAISDPAAQKNLEDNVSYNEFIKFFKDGGTADTSSYKEVLSYYEENKNKFLGVEDIAQGKDANIISTTEPEDIAMACVLASLISREIDDKKNVGADGASPSAEEWRKHPVVSSALKGFDKLDFNASFLAIRTMIGLSRIVTSNFDDVPLAAEIFKKSNDIGEELSNLK